MARRRKSSGRSGRVRRVLRQVLARWRALAAIGAVLGVAALFLLLQTYVSVTSRFEGRLWETPSRIYSDSLLLYPRAELSVRELRGRLDRSGYAVVDRPANPGQYAAAASEVKFHPRKFSGSSLETPEGPVRVRFRYGRISSLRDGSGRRIEAVEVEPELLATLYGARHEERDIVALDELPQEFVQAVLAAEDARFFDHGGIDFRAVVRAAWTNVRHGEIVQGGSTITQQTVKNLFLHQRRTWWRKSREAVMSWILDLRYAKERILEVYLNEVYMGQRGTVAICGVQAASRFYFGREIRDLSLSESALLAGLIRSPGRYNPFVNRAAALERRDVVLDAMLEHGLIDRAQWEAARGSDPAFGSGKGGFNEAPWVVDFVLMQLRELYPEHVLRDGGLTILTTLDTRLQAAAQRALASGLGRLERDASLVRGQKKERTLEGAMVVLEPDTGAVRALIGGRDYRHSQFNRAVQSRRQPGSCFKPFVFAAAFQSTLDDENPIAPTSLLEDEPLSIRSGGEDWSPRNHDGEFRGVVTVREALEQSLNVPTVNLATRIGLTRVIETARSSGIASELRPLPSMALGSMEVSPLELASAFGTLANQGVHSEPLLVREILDAGGARVERRGIESRQVIDPRAAFLVTELMRGAFDHGTARSARAMGFRGVAAGKTGTTDDTRDAWFVGYTPSVLALVWIGYDDNAKTGLSGSTGALPVWVDFMRQAGLDRTARHFLAPPGIVRYEIDPATGQLARAACPEVIEEYFTTGSQPWQRCMLHGRGFRRWLDRFRDKRRPGRVGTY